MRWISLIAIPLFTFTLASPVHDAKSAGLAKRAGSNSLSARTDFEHDWRCNDDGAKKDCRKKGGEWACDKYCHCIQKPVDCPTYCSGYKHKKDECEHKDGYRFNDDKCACEATCPDSKAKKDKCTKDQGWFNDAKCSCEGAKCVDNQIKGEDCKYRGGKWDEKACKCTVVCNEKDKAKCAKDFGWFNPAYCRCEGAKCPDNQIKGDDCKYRGGSWDEKACKCTVVCNEKDKAKCAKDLGWFNPATCQCEGAKCVDNQIKGDDCKYRGGSWDEKACKCTVVCNEKDKAKCAKDFGWFNPAYCRCEGAKCPDNEIKGNDCRYKGGKWDEKACKCTEKEEQECGDWGRVEHCKSQGKKCNKQCDCY